jgi:hypothetical protein
MLASIACAPGVGKSGAVSVRRPDSSRWKSSTKPANPFTTRFPCPIERSFASTSVNDSLSGHSRIATSSGSARRTASTGRANVGIQS